MEIAVSFRRTSSPQFARALELARRETTFREHADERPRRFSVAFNQDSLERYRALIDVVGRWSQTQVLLNRTPVERDRLEHLIACYQRRLAAPDRRAYCAGAEVHQTRVGPARQLFPCRMIPISETNHQGWFQFGRLTRDGVFVVDKGRIRSAVRTALHRTLAEHCPALFPAEIDNLVDRLPDRIDPARDRQWVYKEGWQNGRFVAVGVEKRLVADSGTWPAPAPGFVRASQTPVSAAGTNGSVHAQPGSAGFSAGSDPDSASGSAEDHAPGAHLAPDAPSATGPLPASPSTDGSSPVVAPRPAGRGRERRGPAEEPPAERRVPQVRYREIGGLAPQIRVVRENLELPLRFPEVFERLGVDAHRGLLLAGPPGTGKTLLAKALANECQAHFCLINGPEVLSKWHGESEANLRRIFAEARELAPSVVLIDEIDAIAPDRGRVTHNFEAVLVSQLLSLMDGLLDRGRVVVVATTNRPQGVDPALRRPGRLDLILPIGLPDAEGRLEILRIHTRRMPLAPGVDLPALAAATGGYAGADLASLCREAGLACMRDIVHLDDDGDFVLDGDALGRLQVDAAHFRAALEAVRPRPV